MTLDINLPNSMRATIQSLRQTDSLLQLKTESLSSGNKVNSAIDNPSNFFAASTLNNRAKDLSKLLDNINSAVRVVNETNSGLKSIIQLLDLAETSLQNPFTSDSSTSQSSSLIPDGENLALSFAESNHAVSLNSLPLSGDPGSQVTVEFWMQWDGTNNVMPFSFNRYDLWFRDGSFGFNTFTSNIYGISSAGFENTPIHVAAVFTDSDVASNRLYINGVEQTLTQQRPPATFSNSNAQITTTAQISGNSISPTYSFSGLLDEVRIWDGPRTQEQIVDNMNSTITGPQDGLVALYNFQNIDDGPGGVTDESGNGNDGTLSGITTASSNVVWDDAPLFSSQNQNLLQILTTQYSQILDQIDELANDSSYKGVNLLKKQEFLLYLNETSSSELRINGIDASSNGLKLVKRSFLTESDVSKSLKEIKSARKTLRTFTSSIQNNLNIIKTREKFTIDSVITLEYGARDLTLADQNELSAELLSLRTKLSLGTSMLAISSQQQATILSLF